MNKVLAVNVNAGWFMSEHRSRCGNGDELDTMEIIALEPAMPKGASASPGEEPSSERNV
jgi:hypothetical protein